MIAGLSVVTLMNDEAAYRDCCESLERQAPEGFLEFLLISADAEGLNAAAALNKGLGLSSNEWVVCVHQDVLFPDVWLRKALAELDRASSRTAIVGLVGIRADGSRAGHVSDPHGHTRWLPLPAPVVSLDEHLLIVRRSSGLRFDPANPGFHLYGTEICLAARASGWEAFAIDAPVVHLSGGRLDEAFKRASEWLLGKRGASMRYVIPTCSYLLCRRGFSNLLHLRRVRRNLDRSSLVENYGCSCKEIAYSPLSSGRSPTT